MIQRFTGRTPTSRRQRRRLRNKLAGDRLARYLRRHVEFLDGTGAGVREWNFLQLRDALAKSLRAAGYEVKAKHVEACHRDFRGYRCKKDHRHVWAVPGYTCHIRLCPFEMKSRSVRAQKKFGDAFGKLKHGKYLVLSQRNCAVHALAEGIDSLFEAFKRLYEDFLVPSGAEGAFAALELTFNATDMTWHPHLNVVLDCPMYIPNERLRAAWVAATQGEGLGAWIGAVDSGTVRELLKYITKLVDFIDIPEAVGAFLEATKRRRFIRSWGSLYGLEPEADEKQTSRFCCPDCGCPEFEEIGLVERERVFWDSSGQTRFIFDSG